MGYTQVTIEERCEIARLRAAGASIRQIAAGLDRAPSTVARELKRNASRAMGYRPSYAQEQSRARRWSGSRLERNAALRACVLERLGWGWSPEQVCGHLAREAGRTVISYESIYRFIYAQKARHKDHDWRQYLPEAKWKRGRRVRQRSSSVSFILERHSLAERPPVVADRQTFGHWEADLMQFGRSGAVALVLHERHSRLMMAVRLPSKEAGPVVKAMARLLGPLPPEFRQTVTFDNGTEFVRHHELHALGIETFFCDTHSPWQKGGVENGIGRLRRVLPRKTNLGEMSDERFTGLLLGYNNTPRKCLGYQSPSEIFWSQVLHFKCESTFPPSRERRASGELFRGFLALLSPEELGAWIRRAPGRTTSPLAKLRSHLLEAHP